LEHYFPEARLLLVENQIEPKEKASLFERQFPKVEVVNFETACELADIMIHGPKSGTGGAETLLKFKKVTGKPFGYVGVTIIDMDIKTYNQAAFIFTRDSISIDMLLKAGVNQPKLGWGADGTLALTMRNDSAADLFLSQNRLEKGKYICVIPRLRKTPSKWMNGHRNHPDDAERMEYNIRFLDNDTAILRKAMVEWVKATGNKVLLCPETTYQLDLFQEYLIDPLPSDIKGMVVKRTSFWLPDEAASTYQWSRMVLSQECHSPLISYTTGIPAIYIRQPEDTHKGQMYYDMGLEDLVMEIEEINGEMLAERMLFIHHNYESAKEKVENALQFVWDNYDHVADTIHHQLAQDNITKKL
jgi:hypothetical protein